MLPPFEQIISSAASTPPGGATIGRSRDGRAIAGHRIGSGPTHISLIGGCHADEPVGPWLLAKLVACLNTLPDTHDLLSRLQWWIVPHVNPDGAERNRKWVDRANGEFHVVDYLTHVVREAPGEDIEFGFPRDASDDGARPENRAVYNWWSSEQRPFALHVSLHGMAFAGGPWFLIDPDWADRGESLMMRCQEATSDMGYRLHDVQRFGEKGFVRIERGFTTRPNSKAMASFFVDRGEPETAELFRPSSMETIRAFGGDALTLVSEIPLFILPGVGEQIVPTDPAAELWKLRIEKWRKAISENEGDDVLQDIKGTALHPMPIADQMRLQWTLIDAGLEQIAA